MENQEKKTGFLTDDKGNPSSTRVLAFITCLVGLAIGLVGAFTGKLSAEVATLSGTFVGMALGVKAISKSIESKTEM